MDNIVWYILVALVGYFAVSVFSKLFAFYWKTGYDTRKEKRARKRDERRKWKYCVVSLDNPILNKLADNRTVIFMGDKGKGKSKMMNLFAHFLFLKRKENIKKNKRAYKYTSPDMLAKEKELEHKNLLPIYANISYVDSETGAHEQDLKPYFEMQKKAVEQAIFCIDEVSSTYGKDVYNNNNDYTKEQKKDIKENTKKNRHYTNGWILGTEQDGQDIFLGIRENGYVIVHCLQTVVTLLPLGKFLRTFRNMLLTILPAILTINLIPEYRKCLTLKQKICLFLKSLLPAYFSLPTQYYFTRYAINEAIKFKYQRFATRFSYDNLEWWIRYSHADIFADNTRAYKQEYEKLFDSEGNRKKESKINEK